MKKPRSYAEAVEAQRFQSITLKNFEQFGVKEANTPKQASGIDYAALDAVRTPW